MVLPTSSPCRVGLLAGICWTKSQSPLFSGPGGALVTNDWSVKRTNVLFSSDDELEVQEYNHHQLLVIGQQVSTLH